MTKKQTEAIERLTALATMAVNTQEQTNGKARVQWFEKACDDYETMETVTMTKRGIIHNNGRLQITSSDQVW